MRDTPNFNRLARAYRWLEWFTFGPILQRCRCAFLKDFSVRRNAIIYGDGDGRFTARLLQANPNIHIEAVDSSNAMLRALLCNAGPHASRVTIHHADARRWQPPTPPCDLIVTHFFLDCLSTEEVAALASRLRANSTPTAYWIVSDFAIPRGVYGALIARPLVSALYFAFRILTGLRVHRLPNHAPALTQAGFALNRHRTWLGGLLVSQLWTSTPQTTE